MFWGMDTPSDTPAAPRRRRAAPADHQSPAAVVTQAFGSSNALANALDIHASTAWRWLRGGLIPAEYHVPILDASDRIGLGLTPDDLVRGRTNR